MTFIAALLICLPTKIINESGLAWNKDDDRVFKSAVLHCRTDPMFAYDTPCLGVLYKREVRSYGAICTYKREIK